MYIIHDDRIINSIELHILTGVIVSDHLKLYWVAMSSTKKIVRNAEALRKTDEMSKEVSHNWYMKMNQNPTYL